MSDIKYIFKISLTPENVRIHTPKCYQNVTKFPRINEWVNLKNWELRDRVNIYNAVYIAIFSSY